MKSLLSSITILSIFFNAYGQNISDRAGVYITKEDFTKNNLSYATPYRLKEKFGFLNSDFDYVAKGTILLKQSNNKNFLSFKSGKIYGFYSENKKFLYVPAIKKYLVFLNEKPITILLGEDITYYRFGTHTNLLLFYLNGQKELKPMNDENLNNDFYKVINQLTALQDIQKKFEETKKNQNNKNLIPKISKYIKEKIFEDKKGISLIAQPKF
jgi:hypothetical protein